jgi:hypothetical protein
MKVKIDWTYSADGETINTYKIFVRKFLEK